MAYAVETRWHLGESSLLPVLAVTYVLIGNGIAEALDNP
jgi:hypothetical protein